MEKRSHRRNVIWWHKRPSRALTRVRSDMSDIHDGQEQNAPFKGPNTDALGRSSHVTAGMSPFKLETHLRNALKVPNLTTSASGRSEMASQSIGVPETRVPKWPTMLKPTDL
jgi:hypothetical protein